MDRPKTYYQWPLYDWDATVQHTLHAWYSACVIALAEESITLDERTIARDIVPHLDHAKNHGVIDVGSFVRRVVAQALPNLVPAMFNEELWQTIQTLKKEDFVQAIVSSSTSGVILQSLAHHRKDASIFAHLVTRDNFPKTKPDPAPIHEALRLLGATTGRAIMIGDSKADILAGQGAGIDTIWIYPVENEPFYDPEEMLALKPTHVAHSGADVYRIITEGK